jgi:hypothetical protein
LLLLYAACGQSTFYKTDGICLIHYVNVGTLWGSVHHVLYLPILDGFHALLAPVGVSVYRAAVLLSAGGSALGVAFAHAGYLRLGLDRTHAALAALLAGLAPAVCFFATVVEYHGLFFGAAGLAFWVLTWTAQRPTFARATLLGLATYFAATVHATGHVLPALTCGWLVALGWNERRWLALRPALVAGVVHLLLLFGVPLATRAFGNTATPESQTGIFALQHFAAANLPLAFAREWLLAFAPLSAVLVLRPRPGTVRLEWAAMLVAMLPYTLLSWGLNTGNFPSECGAYWLPLALPAARVAVAVLPRAGALALAVACAGCGLFQILRHDDPSAGRAYARDLELGTRGRPCVLLIGDPAEAAALLIERPAQEYLPLDFLSRLSPAALQQQLPQMHVVLQRWQGEDRDVYLTSGARDLLGLVEPLCGPGFRLLLEQRYSFERVDVGTFHAERLVAKD